jgi:hypothetical protein
VSREVAKWLANELRGVAQLASTEEDLRISSEAKLGQAMRRLGIPSSPRYERVYANHAGRSDAVYGRVVIEYEAVGALSNRRGVDHAAEQLERYLRAEVEGASDYEALRRVVGVGLDGYRIFFLRFRGGVTDEEPEAFVAPGQGILPMEDDPALRGGLVPVLDGPYDVNTESIQTFLLYLRAATRSRLTPEGLAKQFGPDGPCAKSVVRTLARLLEENSSSPKVSTFFEEWDRIFGIVYGVDLDKANRHLPILQEAYGLDQSHSLKIVLFSVHTYYALLMKLLAAELVSMQRESLIDSYLADLPSADEAKLRRAVERIEDGDVFAHFSVQNFLEADFFGWYQYAWSPPVAEAVRSIVRLLVTFEPASGALDPRPTQDLLKRLYQFLVPKEIRHDLGEYYTPNWLADLVIEESGYDGDQSHRVLDPACGSGTFLVAAINLVRHRAQAQGSPPAEVAKAILDNVVGFELNPLAVIAARTNYLLALGPLLRELPLIQIPVYLCDSILAPSGTDVGLFGEEFELRTSAGVFQIPSQLAESKQLARLTGLLDRFVRDDYTVDEFKALIPSSLDGVAESTIAQLANLYRSLVDLQHQGRDGIWVRVIRNAFAPLTSGLFDFVLGNPPWVNWQSLAENYRAATAKFWIDYGLFSLKGHSARLGGGKKDVSALMLYRCMDAYLRGGGTLSFVITHSLFKSKGAGDGFRRFQLGRRARLRVRVVHDLTQYQPFQGATTQTSIVVLETGSATEYPGRYIRWHKKKRIVGLATASLVQVRAASRLEELAAAPVDRHREQSPWLTARPEVDAAVRGIIGKSAYRGFAGVCTWANGIYWLEIREKAPGSLLRVRNVADEAKERDVEAVDALIEKAHVYPLVRSRNIRRWAASPSLYILVPQDPNTRRGIPEGVLRTSAPRTYRFLKEFERRLAARSGMLKYFSQSKGDAFYSVYNVSAGTFAPYKVMWRQMVPRITAAVVGPREDPFLGDLSPVSQHVVSMIATEDEHEAHYLCAVLNSAVSTSISASYSTGKSYGTPSMLDYVPIPRFNADDPTHNRLAVLSTDAHLLTAQGRSVASVEEEIDYLAAGVLGVDQGQLPDLIALVGEFAKQKPAELELEAAEGSDEP